jgi:hypothetical protein
MAGQEAAGREEREAIMPKGVDWGAIQDGVTALVAAAAGAWVGVRRRLQAGGATPAFAPRFDAVDAALARIEARQTQIQIALTSIGERALSLDEALTSGETPRIEKIDAIFTWTGAPGEDQTRVSRFTALTALVSELRNLTQQQAAVSEQHMNLLREMMKALTALRPDGRAT